VIVPEDQALATVDRIRGAGYSGQRIGTVDDNVGRVRIGPAGLVGTLDGGESSFSPA
jgi:hypothetical protein